MKKALITGFIALGALGLLGNKVQADDQTKLSYQVDSEYLISIPATVELDEGRRTYIDIKTISHNIDPDRYVSLSITDGLTSDSEITLKRDSDTTANISTLKSTITKSGAPILINNPEIGSFDYESGQTDSVATLFVDEPEGDKRAGTYLTTLTFTSEYKSKMIGEE
ncbi:hypothetical protein [Enterococcus thailandicus]|uniref:hypothetical protein n=1 Tax=Enterococcus thailandicus TaxID=417368 RepID=UPI0022E43C96|nr:hypothetical protein [Enterococcus thailandicus]